MDSIADLSEYDVTNFIASKKWADKTRKQNEWRINQIITASRQGDGFSNPSEYFNNIKKYSWFKGLYKELHNLSLKTKSNNDTNLEIINLKKELTIYQKNMSAEQIQSTLNLVNAFNEINLNKVLTNVNKKLNEDEEKIQDEKIKDEKNNSDKEAINFELTNVNKKLMEDKIKSKEKIRNLEQELERITRINTNNYNLLQKCQNTNTEELEDKLIQKDRHIEALEKEVKELTFELQQ
tara:strand:+ start:1163 stop:1873 length:711 start_codon:yes stop_codon:yes gene_type:complete